MTLATAHLYNGGGNPLLSLPLSHGGVGPGEVCPFLQPLTPPPHSQGTRRAPHSPATQRRGRGGRGQVRSGPHPGCRRGVYCSSRTQVRRQEVLLRVLERGWRLEPPIGSGRGRSAFPATGRDEWLPDATGWGRGQTGCPASAPPHRLRGGTGDAETWVLPAPPPPPALSNHFPRLRAAEKGNPAATAPPPRAGTGSSPAAAQGPRGPRGGVLGARIPAPVSEAPAPHGPRALARGAGPRSSAPRARTHRPRSRATRAAAAGPRAPRSGRIVGERAQASVRRRLGLTSPKRGAGTSSRGQTPARPAPPGAPRPAFGRLLAPRAHSPSPRAQERGASVPTVQMMGPLAPRGGRVGTAAAGGVAVPQLRSAGPAQRCRYGAGWGGGCGGGVPIGYSPRSRERPPGKTCPPWSVPAWP